MHAQNGAGVKIAWATLMLPSPDFSISFCNLSVLFFDVSEGPILLPEQPEESKPHSRFFQVIWLESRRAAKAKLCVRTISHVPLNNVGLQRNPHSINLTSRSASPSHFKQIKMDVCKSDTHNGSIYSFPALKLGESQIGELDEGRREVLNLGELLIWMQGTRSEDSFSQKEATQQRSMLCFKRCLAQTRIGFVPFCSLWRVDKP